ncbi:hypothetical protein LBMAG42_14790 [Deltaproteobacteria bacterium]|nr:hypothetical protein LBMAG42_14790 [Deltaproteobacteria bacterium]
MSTPARPAPPELVLAALGSAPPVADPSGFAWQITTYRDHPQGSAEQISASVIARFSRGHTSQWSTLAELVSGHRSRDVATLRAVHARLSLAWLKPGPLHARYLTVYAALIELVEAHDSLGEPLHRMLLWLLDPSRPHACDPRFAEALAGSLQDSAGLEAAIPTLGARVPKTLALIEPELAATRRLIRKGP